MVETPVIVISSPQVNTGKTTLALNLSSALWNENYEVKIFSHNDELCEQFIEKRKLLKQNEHHLYMPKFVSVDDMFNDTDRQNEVIVADVPSVMNEKYREIFEKAHTLITVINDINDLVNGKNNEYLELVWEAKKVIAQKGIKNLNWIVVLNNLMHYSETDVQKMLYQHSKRYGYRMFLGLKNREAFKHIYEGLCIGDMIKTEKKSMTMNDLYAHREILKLTDFLWNYK